MRGGACDDGGVAGGGELVVRGDAAQRDDVEHLLAALRLLQAARGPDAHKQRDGEVVLVLQQVGERAVGRGEVDVGLGESAHQAPHVREKSVPHHVREERRRAAEKVDGHRAGHFESIIYSCACLSRGNSKKKGRLAARLANALSNNQCGLIEPRCNIFAMESCCCACLGLRTG